VCDLHVPGEMRRSRGATLKWKNWRCLMMMINIYSIYHFFLSVCSMCFAVSFGDICTFFLFLSAVFTHGSDSIPVTYYFRISYYFLKDFLL
jgi:hypothetical protein